MVMNMDKIQITITRGCDESGNGGTVIDTAGAVLGTMTDGTPILDAIAAAFADAYGLYEVDGEPVTPYRNVSYQCRKFMTEVVFAYASKQAAAMAQAAAQQQTQAALSSVQIVEG
jgi:hypothetical protein